MQTVVLGIDVGNTHTVIGCFAQSTLLHTWRVSTHPLCTSDEFRLKFIQLIGSEGITLSQIEGIMVSSVVPTLTQVLNRAFQGLKVFHVSHTSPFSFDIATDIPSQVGADLLVNSEAAVREYSLPCIVVDSGTATTLSAISNPSPHHRPRYLGTAIIPGIETSMKALSQNTAQLLSIGLEPPYPVIGKNTTDSIKSGLLIGHACLIDGMIDRFKEVISTQCQVPKSKILAVATGGISERMNGLTREIQVFDPNLTLTGIRILYENQSKCTH